MVRYIDNNGLGAISSSKFEVGTCTDGTLESRRSGADFGQLNGLDRRVLSLGGTWRAPFAGRGLDLSAAFYRAQGERVVGNGGDNVGYHSLGVTAVSGALLAEL